MAWLRCISLLAGSSALLLSASAASAEPVVAGAGFGAAGIQNCRSDLLYLNQLFGWQWSWQQQWKALETASDADLRAAIATWDTAPAALRADEAGLLPATQGGPGAAPKVIAERVLAEVDDLAKALRGHAPPVRADADPELKRRWEALFAERITPAVEQYRDFLRDDYLPHASASAGLSDVPDGPRCFRQSVRYFTSADPPPEQIEALGSRLLSETEDQLASLYHVKRAAVPALLERLRSERDPDFDAAALVGMSRAAIARAAAAMPRMFLEPVKHPILVEPMPRTFEASAAAGLYQPASGDHEAAYVVNLSRPQDRRLMAEAIAFHEGLPGHHTKYALDLPEGDWNSGFAEGWALYSEYLADEMHLYTGRLDRAGMMAKHLWAASRLVVEPGLHLRGWSREQALAFMHDHTALSDAEIAVEVDRYIATPGQSLTYMLGYDTIARARRYAERKLGNRFDLRQFHEVIIGRGSRSLDKLYADVVRWADSQAKG